LREAERIDQELGAELPYAWHKEFGFLTACPTNTGTGMRASVLIHLPGLVLTQEIGKVLQQPDVVAKFKDMGFEIGGTPQAQFAAQVAGDLDRWVRLIKKAGVTLD
jgi:hypothetical protein